VSLNQEREDAEGGHSGGAETRCYGLVEIAEEDAALIDGLAGEQERRGPSEALNSRRIPLFRRGRLISADETSR